MDLIKEVNNLQRQIKEDSACGSVGTGSIAGNAMPLLQTLVKRTIPTNPRVIKYKQSSNKTKKKKTLGISEEFHILEDLSPDRSNSNFDTTEVIAKLKSLENKESVDFKDTATFGLVDSKGGIVKVTIPSDQSSSFEQDIQHFMGDYGEEERTPEIAEILFKLKDNYTIVNVEWPAVEEDAEESTSTLEQPEGGLGEEQPEGDLGELGDNPTPPQEDTSSVTSLLTQVIDMMKADADARKSEAQAREAESKTRQAVAAREQAMARVKQEEQNLDMDEYNKNKKEREKEAKRLAQLAKWKHDLSSEKEQDRPAQEPSYDFLPGDEEYNNFGKSQPSQENEERSYRTPVRLPTTQTKKQLTGKVSSSDIAKFITSRVS